MDYHIVIDPESGLDPEAFAEAWNETPECLEISEASLSQQRIATGAAAGIVTAVLINVVSGAALELIKMSIEALVKRKLNQRKSRRSTTITDYDQPDGSRLLVVTINEE